ncbi:MAG: T9SS type A sorting domain-containing protein [Ignavibacteria bacterium]|nr:T9SS type A sorting domain-containing protein [Ignavibacteria bacterium]
MATYSQVRDIYQFYPEQAGLQNLKGTYSLYPFDTCSTFLENIFTIGTARFGTQFVQIDNKKIEKRSNGRKVENRIENDTSRANRIISVRESERDDKILIFLQIENKEQKIRIMVYNLLGKKVLDVYEGKPKDSSQPYEFSALGLPKGIFLLVVLGDNFRLREKLVITK